MNDVFERLRAFRADQAPPSGTAEAAARSALSELIRDGRGATSNGAAPLPTQPGAQHAPAGFPNRGRRPAHDDQSPPSRDPDRGRRTHRRRWSVRTRVAVAAGLVGAAIVIAGAIGLPTATAPPSALAAALEQLARVAASSAWSGVPGPHQYVYTKSDSLTESDVLGPGRRECVIKQTQRREIWIATNGSGEIRETNTNSYFTSPADRATCALDRITNPATQNSRWNNRFGPHGLALPTNDWHALSTDPAKLLIQLRRLDGGPRSAAEDFVHIGDFMRESDAPPAIRAALYRAAALIPGVKLLGPVRDHAGRIGLGVAYVRDGRPWSELIFDRRTAKLLGEAYFAPSGKLADWTVYLEAKIVDRLPPAPMAH